MIEASQLWGKNGEPNLIMALPWVTFIEDYLFVLDLAFLPRITPPNFVVVGLSPF